MNSVHLFSCDSVQIQKDINIIMPGKSFIGLSVFWDLSVNSAVNIIIIVKHSTDSQAYNELN